MAVVFVVFVNNRGQTIKLKATKSWPGDFIDKPAGSVAGGQRCQFAHRGSKCAVIYGEDPGASSNPVGYLLAWSYSPMRVLVECGPLSQILYDGWDSAALCKLDKSSDESSAKNDSTSSSARARIRDNSGTFTMGVASANFA